MRRYIAVVTAALVLCVLAACNMSNLPRSLSTGAPETLQFSDAQIELLIQAGEPDALLAQLDRSPENVPLADVKRHYEIARDCIERWQQSGSTDRGVLRVFARRVFASEGDWLKDEGRVQQELRAAAASVT